MPGRTLTLELLESSSESIKVLLDGRSLQAFVSSDSGSCWVTVNGRTFRLARSAGPSRPAAVHQSAFELIAPMPGQVRSLNVHAGDLVTKGQLLAVLEAMKMEIRLSAPFDARVISVQVDLGQSVDRDQVIIHLQAN